MTDNGVGRERYLEHLIASSDGSLDGMTLVVDCANGAASGFAPQILRRLGAVVHPIFDQPDGDNINVGCGALHPGSSPPRSFAWGRTRVWRTTGMPTGRCSRTHAAT